ncbi:MAG: GNAT family N-acetyltransferase [Defluviitaleaceae bacterium]|nr:GNAT family N-acetyltransferase [Defluviitaleaceae bacterium]
MENTPFIRQTIPADLDAVMQIYTAARAEMAATGNPHQWGDSHPPRAMIEADIDAGKSYVLVDETNGNDAAYPRRIRAVFYFAIEDDPTYAEIDGAWLDVDVPYGVVHRIARAPGAKGAGAACLAWCFGQCGNIRIDTMAANASMHKLLVRLGYKRCGVIRLGLFDDPAMDERIAYQKTEPRAAKEGN